MEHSGHLYVGVAVLQHLHSLWPCLGVICNDCLLIVFIVMDKCLVCNKCQMQVEDQCCRCATYHNAMKT